MPDLVVHQTFEKSEDFWQWWNTIMVAEEGWEEPKAIVDAAGLYWYVHISFNHNSRRTLEDRRKIVEAAIKLGYLTNLQTSK